MYIYIYIHTCIYIHTYLYIHIHTVSIYIYAIYGMMLTTVFGNHVCIGEFLLLGLLEGGVISGKTGSVLVTVNTRTCLRIGSYNAKKTSSKIAISGKDPFQPINCPHLQAKKCRIRLGKAVELRTQKAVHSWDMTETDGIFNATIPLFAVFKTPLPNCHNGTALQQGQNLGPGRCWKMSEVVIAC